MPDEQQHAPDAPKQALVLRGGCGGTIPPVEHRWKPGQSGNPMGRRLSKELDRQLDEGETARMLIQALISEGLGGNVNALKEIFERHEGRVVQKSEVDEVQRTIVIEAGIEETPEPVKQQP
jgi:hypothetical protein